MNSEFLASVLAADFTQLLIAFLLALPIAYDREQSTRIMGLRTYPLVAVATCGFVLIGLTFIRPDDTGAQARIVQGIMAGIGFIGGGAILKQGERVLGTASAASIWMTGAIGVAVSYARYDIAIFLSLANFVILRLLTPLKDE
jgi:putative Mg2+ transporter-C (MgtC) family protein